MSLCFRDVVRGLVAYDGIVHAFDTWMTEPDEFNQITECAIYLPDAVYNVIGVPWVLHKDLNIPQALVKAWTLVGAGGFVTCLPCAGLTRRGGNRW